MVANKAIRLVESVLGGHVIRVEKETQQDSPSEPVDRQDLFE